MCIASGNVEVAARKIFLLYNFKKNARCLFISQNKHTCTEPEVIQVKTIILNFVLTSLIVDCCG